MAREPFYVTTPPLPPTREPDLTAARELIGADVVARHQRRLGRDVRLVATLLEQGQGVERAAYERGGTLEDLADEWAERCEATLNALHIQHDGIARTTEPQHQHVVKAFFLKLFDQGDIYKQACKSRYCPRCREALPERPKGSDAEAACPHCGGPATEVEEEAFFLRASKYQKVVLEHIEEHPDFILPASRREAILEGAAQEGLPDVRISRPASEWAIPVPISPNHAIDASFDTLITYLTASGYLADPQMFERYWPPSLQIVTADELPNHALAWPAVLAAVGLALPERLLVHGTLRLESDLPQKAAATLADPATLAGRIGTDAFRLAVLRAAPCTEDGVLSHRQAIELGNRHLAGELGRLVDTTLAAIAGRREGAVPRSGGLREPESSLVEAASALHKNTGEAIDAYDFPAALDHVWGVVGQALGYAETCGVAALGAQSAEPRRLNTALYVLAEVCRLIAHSLFPLLPGAASQIEARLGVNYDGQPPTGRHQWGLTQPQTPIGTSEQLFARIVLPSQ